MEPDSSSAASASQLTINSDTIEADTLWKGQEDDLARKAKTATQNEYQVYVARRAAQLIRDNIAEILLYQHAKRRLTPEMEKRIDSFVDAEIRKTVTTDFDGRQRRYEKSLQAKGQTLQDVHEGIRKDIIITSFLETEIKPKVGEPTRQELLEAFETTADSYRRPTRRRMSLIDVRFDDPSSQDPVRSTVHKRRFARDEARSRIETAQAELKSGHDFTDVARRWSDGLHAAEGGDWGWVTRGSVRRRFEPVVNALYQLDVGEISEIIETEKGFCLVRCDEIDPGVEPDFQTLQLELIRRITQKAYNKEVFKLVERLRKKARIGPDDLERFYTAVVKAAPAYPSK